MRTSDCVIVEDRDRVRTITLNRPEALNAFNDKLYDGAGEANPTASPIFSIPWPASRNRLSRR